VLVDFADADRLAIDGCGDGGLGGRSRFIGVGRLVAQVRAGEASEQGGGDRRCA
jgi:hypothetical protein